MKSILIKSNKLVFWYGSGRSIRSHSFI